MSTLTLTSLGRVAPLIRNPTPLVSTLVGRLSINKADWGAEAKKARMIPRNRQTFGKAIGSMTNCAPRRWTSRNVLPKWDGRYSSFVTFSSGGLRQRLTCYRWRRLARSSWVRERTNPLRTSWRTLLPQKSSLIPSCGRVENRRENTPCRLTLAPRSYIPRRSLKVKGRDYAHLVGLTKKRQRVRLAPFSLNAHRRTLRLDTWRKRNERRLGKKVGKPPSTIVTNDSSDIERVSWAGDTKKIYTVSTGNGTHPIIDHIDPYGPHYLASGGRNHQLALTRATRGENFLRDLALSRGGKSPDIALCVES